VTADSVWDADTVRVVGNVTVEDGVTLTVVPGARVEFADFYDLTVLGRILAVGTPEAPIIFTSDEPGSFAADSTTVGCWNGIRFPWTPSSNEWSRIEHCVIECSKAIGGRPFGGAVSVTGFSKLLVRNSVFRSNAATYGGALSCSHQAAPVLVGNLFHDNTAFLRGSGVYVLYAYPDITGSTIAGNAVLNDEPFDATGAVHNHISKSRVTGSIVRHNTSAYYVPTQLLEAKGYYTTFSNIEYGHGGEGNIDEDALFVGFGIHPYALLPESPCVEAGPPDTLGLALPAVDLAGLPRVDGGRIDIGAYEGAGGTGVWGDAFDGAPLLSPRPNPFRRRTALSFFLPARGAVSLRLYDAAGRRVRTLVECDLGAGRHEVAWDGKDGEGRRVASGVYLAELVHGGDRHAGAKLVFLR
jgi:hypothetical protein